MSLWIYFQAKILSLITNQVGELPEYEKTPLETDTMKENKRKSILKKYKSLRYFLFPIAILLITFDEIYIRIKDKILNEIK